MSVRNIERAFNALHSQHNEEAALADPAQARVQQAQTEADRLRSLSTSMTTADVIERILLHYAERDYFRLLELPAPEADVLGNVTWQGTALEVSKAYRRLSVLVHPDKNPGEDARKAFEALNEAHRVLKDADKRDTLLKEHLDAALGRRWGREARATLEERVALNAAQAQEAAALRKQETLQYEAQYLASLPLASMYERSYMHRDTVTAVAVARGTDFFLTASADGVLKFWKKLARGVEFAKQYRAHVGPITALAVSADGSLAATASTDASVKVFDIGSFDMIAMLRLPFVPGAIEWAFQRGNPVARLAVSDLATPAIAVFDARSGGDEELGRVTLHSSPVTAMKFSPEQGAVISADAAGMVEYWDPGTLASPAAGLRFDFKLDTDLYALARAGTTALSLAVARDGARWAALCADGRVRLFRYATGRLLKVLDESLAAAAELQRSGPEAFRLEPIDFGRRAAAEKELAAALGVVSAVAGAGLGTRDAAPPRPATPNVVFDESGNFLLVPSLLGVKVVNLATNACAGVIGGGEGGERFLGLALFQGGGARGRRLLAAGAESAAAVDVAADPTLLACAAGRQRLYLFTRREPAEEASGAGGGRDVYNERPLGGEGEAGEAGGGAGASGAGAAAPDLPRGAVVHTTRGDIALKLFPDECPRTVENFTTHARNGYYDGVLFHRVIKGFMLQTGDPLGDGTGGESIWGGEFEDEISRNLRHDRPFTLSMANAGPNTNGSQFFITTAATPWLDGKHTVFGRVVKGMDVVVSIEKCKTHPKTDKPFDDIRIINVEPRASVE